jgi:hypothetical protein
VRDNLATLYGAVDDGAVRIALPAFVKKELEGFLDCGLACRGFARLKCESCGGQHLVSFSCKGRGFCPSCLGRRMASTAANLVEHVLPTATPLRQWVLTVPHPWRKRLAYDGALLGALTRIFVSTVLRFYKARMKKEGVANGQGGAVVVVQRTSSDLKTNPHLHVLFLDGVYRELGDEVVFHELPRLSTREVGEVLERTVERMTRYVRRRERSGEAHDSPAEDDDMEGDDVQGEDARGLAALAASAVDGRTPPAGPEWRRKRGRMPPLVPHALAFDKPLCASKDGFTLHAATRAGGLDAVGREALCKYVLRPAVAQERVTQGPDGLVRILLKKPFSDGTVAVDMDPLSLLCRLAASVPPPRLHMVRYAGILAPASKLRSRVVPKPVAAPANDVETTEPVAPKPAGSHYRPWAELLKRCFAIDVLKCESCGGRMRLVALVTDLEHARRFLRGIGQPTEAPRREPARGPPYWKSRVLRRASRDDEIVA